ncbi:hypothetical protein COCSADRAFT_335321 [Bipolaris sorokiniana ND90Pr]|uniref:Uncharacterized protein n=1 Tax=Cochliobolus sativus (strain ND90Pr / ATCC 201652) TaxID=665912 RepID=M2R7E0_COCSN|nr:uncharacterized protein COCSADRAFT_335321 [Bipolaris sorokiniana ND90Pr]EMD62909.1 hypothetical protein COCSADRAFT_335321 [Bipolaris sorokiniana ND90Pr]
MRPELLSMPILRSGCAEPNQTYLHAHSAQTNTVQDKQPQIYQHHNCHHHHHHIDIYDDVSFFCEKAKLRKAAGTLHPSAD